MSPGSSRLRRRPAKKNVFLGLSALGLAGGLSAEARVLNQNNKPEEKVELIQTEAETTRSESKSIFAKKDKKNKVAFFETSAKAGTEATVQSWSTLGVIHKTEYWGEDEDTNRITI
jgi:hypothetical protein